MAGFWSIIIPEATTNLVTNPSIFTDATGFTAVGGSITRDASYMRRERSSLKVTPTAGVNDGAYYGTVSLTNGQSYTFSVDILGTDGEPYTIYFANTGGTKQGSSTDFTATGEWERQEVTWACNSTASYRLYVTKNNDNNTDNFYVDGFQCENLAYSTTYIDGNHEGGRWTGTEHISTSKRDAQSRLGGRVYNLDTYGFYVDDMPGIGMPPILHQTQEQPMLPGSLLRGFKTKPRIFDLIATQIGTTHEDLHSKRKDLLNAIKPDLVLEPQPFILRYTGANAKKPVEIRVVYDSGYQFTKLEGFTERDLPLRFIAYDEPYFYEIGDTAKTLTTKSTLTTNRCLAKEDGVYNNMDTGANATVWSMFYNPINGLIYMGGSFTQVGSGPTSASLIASWNGTSWSALSTGVSGGVPIEMIVDASGDMYVVGAFDSPANRIAKWDYSSWSAVGTGFDDTARAIVVEPSTGDFIVGGDFTTAGGNAASRIARWNGSAWSQINADTFNNEIRSIAIAENGDIYIGGGFNDAVAPTNYIARWDSSSWNAVGTDTTNQVVNAIAIASNGDLYAAGNFTAIGGISANYIAKWNGSFWTTLSTGANNEIRRLYIDPSGLVYVSGKFSSIGGVDADGIAIWNGSTWSNLDVNIPTNAEVWGLAFSKFDMYLGLTDAGTSLVSYTNTVTNNGTRSAYPKIAIKRSGGTSAAVKWARNETTGAILYLNYDLLDGENLTLDFTEGNRLAISSLYGTVWSSILRSSDVANFYLAPGDNAITLFVDDAGAPTITAYIQWQNTHWSADGVAQ